ncbi:nucleoside/nucleotide kinase family protein [Angustibacter aerolatus]|uniref:Uridine kinase n=1 Tax=Angustibacter aerolatus TaxID=1162965 RepID=A0ABQ6JJT2_9ACTN|nr:hypothetical protein [Angustibacter aerolatus]GMA88497.1 uridine kinase [Angustibacter aerolatus]
MRVGVDGAVPGDAAALADDVHDRLRALGLPTARVRQRDFWLPRSQRLELGADDPDARWERWQDDAALRREVLDPLGPGGGMQWLPTLRDPSTDRSTRAPRRPAAPGTVVVVDGRFLLRWETADAFDAVVHLRTAGATQRRRLHEQEDAVEAAAAPPSWQRYLDETWPEQRAWLVVRHDHPARPAVLAVDA